LRAARAPPASSAPAGVRCALPGRLQSAVHPPAGIRHAGALIPEGFDVFISNAFAQTAGAAGGESSLLSMLPLVLMFVVLYFVMIRPQMKRQKEHKAMIEAIAKGDEVVTTGGLLGKITKLGESFITLEVAAGVELQVQRGAVVQVLPKGTVK
jgi:preprotein translocase subunit YajC